MSYKFFPNILALFTVTLFLAACQTAPKSSEVSISQGQWDSRLRVKDLTKKTSQTVSVGILARRSPSQVRMEVSAVMGIPVASYVMDEREFASALYRQKRFYQGAVSEKALLPILKIPISPEIFKQAIFDEPMEGSDWSCQKDSFGLVTVCESAERQLRVNWGRNSGQKTVQILHPTFEVDWVFQPPSTEVQFKDETFKLAPPRGFRVIQL